jgi:chromate transporter
VTWFTFLPSFVFILAGAPFIETTHKNLNFTAPLNAITAAVVGVIFNLALFFAYHVIWPNGWQGQFDYVALILMLCASVALFKFKIKVMHVIAASALLGLFIKMV